MTPSEPVTLYPADAGDNAAALATGDFNGDGQPDVLLAASQADGPENSRPEAGEAYVFLGPFTAGETRDAGAGGHDLVVFGGAAGDGLGHAVAAGDFNGDGIDDVAIAAPAADGAQADAGRVYLVTGTPDIGRTEREIDLATRATGGVLGLDSGDMAGFSLYAADIDGEGADDLMIGAFLADGPGDDRTDAGEAYVLHGGDSWVEEAIAADESHAPVIAYGAEPDDRLGQRLSAGDFNGDGRTDLLLAAPFADGPANGRDRAGETSILFAPLDAVIDTAEARPDVTVHGIDPGDQTGHALASGDANGDGLDDVLLGAVSADGPDNAADLAGEAYLVSGSDESPRGIDLAAATTPALIYGPEEKARLGRAAAMGDVNGDGLSDLLLAAPDVPVGDQEGSRAGAVYILYGREADSYASSAAEADITLPGASGGDIMGHEAFGGPPLLAADVNGDGLADVLVSAAQADGPDESRPDSGEAYIVFME